MPPSTSNPGTSAALKSAFPRLVEADYASKLWAQQPRRVQQTDNASHADACANNCIVTTADSSGEQQTEEEALVEQERQA